MCVATMYLAGIERLYYAGGAADGADFFRRLTAHDAKWTRRISTADLRREVGLPAEQRRMPSTQVLAEEARQVFDAFVARQTGDQEEAR
jgi:tRNA(Arg) A34 adenosine deaminase TadA